MAEQKPEEKKAEPTFGQKLRAEGWDSYHECARAEDLNNPDKEYATLGFKGSMGLKKVMITLPAAEWVRILTAVAKRQAGKA